MLLPAFLSGESSTPATMTRPLSIFRHGYRCLMMNGLLKQAESDAIHVAAEVLESERGYGSSPCSQSFIV
jgi:hypothetical protein